MANTKEEVSLDKRLFDAMYSSDIKVLSELAKDKDFFVRLGVAENRNTPEKVLELLAEDEDFTIRLIVATVTKSIHLLSMLAKDENSCVRGRVVRNKNVTVEILNNLASDDSETVRSAVGMVVGEIFAIVVSKNFGKWYLNKAKEVVMPSLLLI